MLLYGVHCIKNIKTFTPAGMVSQQEENIKLCNSQEIIIEFWC